MYTYKIYIFINLEDIYDFLRNFILNIYFTTKKFFRVFLNFFTIFINFYIITDIFILDLYIKENIP